MTAEEKTQCEELAVEIKKKYPGIHHEIGRCFPKPEWCSFGHYQKAWLLMHIRTGKQPKQSPVSRENVSRLNMPHINITVNNTPHSVFVKYMELTGSIHYHDVSQVW